jgi:colicin import membrane protein
MQAGEYIIHIIKSFGVHIFFGVILALSFNFTAPEKEPEVPEISAIDAVVIDQASLDKQVSKIKQQKLDAKAAEEKRVKDLEVRAEEAKRNLQKLEKQKTNSERAAADAKRKPLKKRKKR